MLQYLASISILLVQEMGQIYLCLTAKRLAVEKYAEFRNPFLTKFYSAGFPQNSFKVGYPQIINLNFRPIWLMLQFLW